MKKFVPLTVILSFILALTAACSSDAGTANNTGPAAANGKPETNAANTAGTNTKTDTAHEGDEDVPAAVKAAFPGAQQITKQHKDIPQNQVAEIEKETGGKVPDRDHHSYLAFATKDGKRTQLGAASVVTADGKDIVIVYESKEGMPYISEVRSDGVAAPFLAQFKGKGHDDKLEIGGDLKANGVDEATARAIARAVKVDVLTMQALYGRAHTH